jgi:DNA-binding NarL/FixJ family response regulator
MNKGKRAKGEEMVARSMWLLIVDQDDSRRRELVGLAEPFGVVQGVALPADAVRLLKRYGRPRAAVLWDDEQCHDESTDAVHALLRDFSTPLLLLSTAADGAARRLARGLGASHLCWNGNERAVSGAVAFLSLVEENLEERALEELAREKDLSARQRDVLVRRQRGEPIKDIAGRFGRAESTVSTHVKRISRKFGGQVAMELQIKERIDGLRAKAIGSSRGSGLFTYGDPRSPHRDHPSGVHAAVRNNDGEMCDENLDSDCPSADLPRSDAPNSPSTGGAGGWGEMAGRARWFLIADANDALVDLLRVVVEPFGKVRTTRRADGVSRLVRAHGPPDGAIFPAPRRRGIEIAKRLRRDLDVPVLFVVRGESESRIANLALRLGARHLCWSGGDDVLALLAWLMLLKGTAEAEAAAALPSQRRLTVEESTFFELRMMGVRKSDLGQHGPWERGAENTIESHLRNISKKLGGRSYDRWPEAVEEEAQRLRAQLIDGVPTDDGVESCNDRSRRPGLRNTRAPRVSEVRERRVPSSVDGIAEATEAAGGGGSGRRGDRLP